MQKFELNIDINTPYIKAIRFIGTFMIGLAAGFMLFQFKNGSEIDWLNAFTTIGCSSFFAFFPGRAKKQSLTIDEEGIHTHHYTFHWGERKEIKWKNISALRVDRNLIYIENSIGSSEKIKLPLHTKEQVANLKNYLKEVTTLKQVTYLA